MIIQNDTFMDLISIVYILQVLSPIKSQLFIKMKTNYKATTQQESLLAHHYQTNKISLVQRNSITKLQLFSQQGKVWVKSISDQYQMFRIIIFGLLCKIYSSYSELNQQRLDKFKGIVYDAKLDSLTQQRGLQKQKLFTIIANCLLNRLEVREDIEHIIMGSFNNIPFFDNVIMLSIAEKFQLDYLQTSIQNIQKWLKENLSLKIVWSEDSPKNEGPNEIFFKSKGDMILRHSVQESVDLMSESTDSYRPSKLRVEGTSKLKLLKTISIQSLSPSIKRSSNDKTQKSVSVFQGKMRNPQQKSKLWSLFCCDFD